MQNASTISLAQKVGLLLKQTLPLRPFYSLRSINGITTCGWRNFDVPIEGAVAITKLEWAAN
jgi:hypothetical protein